MMTSRGTAVQVAGEELWLFPERAAYWEGRRTLIVADLHVGKAAAFRAGGVPLPPGSTKADLDRLSSILHETDAGRLLILGDLYHAREGMAPETLAGLRAWRRTHAGLEVRVVRGNHDRKAGPSPQDLDFREAEEPLLEGPFVFRHDPAESEGGYVLCGHVHPAAVMTGRGLRPLRVPCFCFGSSIGMLPAFGSFTGTARVRPKKSERVFVIAGTEVVEARR